VKRGNNETLVYSNPVKMRIPIGKPGHAFLSRKDRIRGKRVNKITKDNWDKIF
jgi:hypothetical protein